MLASFTLRQRVDVAVRMAMLASPNDPRFIAWADAWFAGKAEPLSWPPTVGRQLNGLLAVEATMMFEEGLIERAGARAEDSLWISMILLGDDAQDTLVDVVEAIAGDAAVARKRRA